MESQTGGAGGHWPRVNERPDARVVPQQEPLYCGCACALTVFQLLGVSVVPTQGDLYEWGGSEPFGVEALASVMNDCQCSPGVWRGNGVGPPEGRDDVFLLSLLMATGPWIAHLRETLAPIGHFVVVNSERDGLIEILDPWEQGTAYEMTTTSFLEFWNYQAVYLKRDGK